MNDNANKLKRPNVQIDHLSNHAVEEDTHSFMASERPEWLWAFFQTGLHTVVRSLRLVRVSSSRMYSWKCMLLSHPNLLDPSWWNSHWYTQFDYLLAVSRSRGGCVGHIEVVIGQGSQARPLFCACEWLPKHAISSLKHACVRWVAHNIERVKNLLPNCTRSLRALSSSRQRPQCNMRWTLRKK